MIKYRDNKELNNMLNENVSESQYGSYTPIIKEILRRRAFEYDFSNERMENEIQN